MTVTLTQCKFLHCCYMRSNYVSAMLWNFKSWAFRKCCIYFLVVCWIEVFFAIKVNAFWSLVENGNNRRLSTCSSTWDKGKRWEHQRTAARACVCVWMQTEGGAPCAGFGRGARRLCPTSVKYWSFTWALGSGVKSKKRRIPHTLYWQLAQRVS